MRNSLKTGLIGVALLGLAACGDDNHDTGGNGDQPVALASSADVLRELSNVGGTLEFELFSLAIDPGTGSQQPTVRTPAPLPRMQPRIAQHAAQTPRASTPVTSACGSSGNDTRTSDSKSRSFSYFSLTATVDYQLDVFAACASQASGGTASTVDGSLERGQTADGKDLYAVFGAGDSGLHLKTSNNTNSTDIGLLGSVEAESSSGDGTASSEDLLGILQVTTAGQSDGAASHARLSLGEDGRPYRIHIISSGFAFDGAYSYSGDSRDCGGGDVHVSTPAGLTVSSSSGNSTSFSGGTLVLSSGDKSVTLNFNADGSASMSGSVTGTLSADDVGNSLLSGACINAAGLL